MVFVFHDFMSRVGEGQELCADKQMPHRHSECGIPGVSNTQNTHRTRLSPVAWENMRSHINTEYGFEAQVSADAACPHTNTHNLLQCL